MKHMTRGKKFSKKKCLKIKVWFHIILLKMLQRFMDSAVLRQHKFIFTKVLPHKHYI